MFSPDASFVTNRRFNIACAARSIYDIGFAFSKKEKGNSICYRINQFFFSKVDEKQTNSKATRALKIKVVLYHLFFFFSQGLFCTFLFSLQDRQAKLKIYTNSKFLKVKCSISNVAVIYSESVGNTLILKKKVFYMRHIFGNALCINMTLYFNIFVVSIVFPLKGGVHQLSFFVKKVYALISISSIHFAIMMLLFLFQCIRMLQKTTLQPSSRQGKHNRFLRNKNLAL